VPPPGLLAALGLGLVLCRPSASRRGVLPGLFLVPYIRFARSSGPLRSPRNRVPVIALTLLADLADVEQSPRRGRPAPVAASRGCRPWRGVDFARLVAEPSESWDRPPGQAYGDGSASG
jgi:hypothetical protein